MHDSPGRRVILLGASNLARGMRQVVEAAQDVWGDPVEIMAAMGHGRSYGQTSSVLGRYLPGILECGLWRDLAERDPMPTTALVTDIGNDLVYHTPVAQAAEWVEECLARLAPQCEKLVLTQLPLESVRCVGRSRYLLFRTLFFPRCRLDLPTVLERAEQLDAEILRLAEKFSACVIRPAREWYGLDPIHVRRNLVRESFHAMLGQSKQTSEAAHNRGGLLRSLYLWSLVPDSRQLFWYRQQRRQPAGRLPGGTTIALY